MSQILLSKLAKKRIGYDLTRWMGVEPYPSESPAGPMVAITNEYAGSDGDIFSHSWKLMNLGKIIGKRTWGGVIGIWPRNALVDGTLTTNQSERIPVVEFVTSSISANWPPPLAKPVTDNLSHNPQVRFYEPDKRGYLLHDVNSAEWQATARAMQNVSDEQSPAFSLVSFIVSHGKSGFTRNG